MKKILIITTIILLSNAAEAELRGYMVICLGEPSNDGRVCVYSPNDQPNYSFEMWIWCLPSENGLSAVQFAISYPDNVIQGDVTINPDCSLWIGSLAEGVSIVFDTCVWEDKYYWTHHQTLFVTDLNPSTIRIVEHPDAYPEPGVWFLNCIAIKESCRVSSGLYLNHCPFATQSASWGAIKSLYKK